MRAERLLALAFIIILLLALAGAASLLWQGVQLLGVVNIELTFLLLLAIFVVGSLIFVCMCLMHAMTIH